MKTAEIWPDGAGGYDLKSTYDAGFVEQLKLSIPARLRAWNPNRKIWSIDQTALLKLRQLLQQFGYQVTVHNAPFVQNWKPAVENIRVNYLGDVRTRIGGGVYASGLDERGEWLYRFSLPSIQNWLAGMAAKQAPESTPLTAGTYYEILDVTESASDAELKAAWRRALKRYHPDINQSQDANEVMIVVSESYRVLSDPKLRRRYDAGRRLSKQAGPQQSRAQHSDPDIQLAIPDRWRCGYMRVLCVHDFKLVEVNEILSFQDIIDNQGRRMTARWIPDMPFGSSFGFNRASGHVEYDWV